MRPFGLIMQNQSKSRTIILLNKAFTARANALNLVSYPLVTC